MTSRSLVLPLGFGLTAVLCVPAASDAAPPKRPAPRVYTNEDLDRVHRLRDQTGVHSVPAEAPGDETTAPEVTPSRGRGEDYWRREASRARDRVQGMEAQAAGLRAQIAQRAEAAGRELTGRRRSSRSGPSSEATLRTKLGALERRMRQIEDDLADRARRDGALPGWLR
jgi:hypothetical protein